MVGDALIFDGLLSEVVCDAIPNDICVAINPNMPNVVGSVVWRIVAHPSTQTARVQILARPSRWDLVDERICSRHHLSKEM